MGPMNEAEHATPPTPEQQPGPTGGYGGYGGPSMRGPDPRRLYREPEEKKIAGVCGGLADYFGIDPTLVRLAVVLLALTTGVLLFVYVIAAVVIPERPPSIPRRTVAPIDTTAWSNGTKVVLILAAIAVIGFGDFDWWFNVPALAIALVGVGVWLLVSERDKPDGDSPLGSPLGSPPGSP